MKQIAKNKLTKMALLVCICSISACIEQPLEQQDDLSPEVVNAIVESELIDPGDNCSSGGYRIKAGTDANMNGVLEESELSAINYLCHGENGISSAQIISSMVNEPIGQNCDNGGIMIIFGLDLNENEMLEETEIQSSFFICHGNNGIDGQDGTNGANGQNGTNGQDGSNGSDGQDGTNGSNGQDGINGIDGQNGINGFTSLSKITIEEPGLNCENGGLKLEAGLDKDGSFILENEEIEFTYYICDGIDGQNGENGQDGNDGSNGQDGNDGSNGLDGNNGYNALTRLTNENSGDFCFYGGLIIEVGLDLNDNNVLDNDEIIDTQYICDGQDGTDGEDGQDGDDGKDGVSSLIRAIVESPGNNCITGGVMIETGLDDNYNGVLDNEEIDAIRYVCNGENAQSDFSEYYFSNELDLYWGTSDVTITKGEESLNDEYLQLTSTQNPSNGFFNPSRSLIHFADVDDISAAIGTINYQVVEAVLYIHVETELVDGGQVNGFGVKTMDTNSPLFVESEANWVRPYEENEWLDSGAAGEFSEFDYSDMFMMPDPTVFTYNGFVPLLLNRDQVRGWISNPEYNNGLLLKLIDETRMNVVNIASSECDDIAERPMLYIKVKKVTPEQRVRRITNAEYKQDWQERSFAEKMIGYYKKF
ncbi:MAG: collagen-like protein [Reichenbachiella sp.]